MMNDEYIRRDDAIEEINKWLDSVGTALVGKAMSYYGELIGCIEDTPAADVAPVVHEKWLLDRWPSWPHRECSRCKIMIPRTKEVPDQYWQYCPNCGARMDGGNEGE